MTREQKEKALAFLKDMQECTYDKIEEIRTAIECLEQQHSEDCVSRQAVVQWLENATDDSIEHAIDSNLEFIPPVTPTQGWIPVSERLPQMREYVLCCEKDKVFIGCMVFEYDGVPVFSKSDYKHFYVTAWMPLPEPYKAERRE